MFQSIRAATRWLGWAVLGPSLVSAIIFLLFRYTVPVGGYLGGGFLCIISCVIAGGLADETSDDKVGSCAVLHVVWAIVAIVLAIIFLADDINVSVTRTTLLLPSIIWPLNFIDFIYRVVSKISKHAEEQRFAEEAARQQVFVDRIIDLIGDECQTKALLTAIERLTPYAKEEADRILSALSRDAERYIMLRANEGTTSNDILKAESGKEADSIAEVARTLCADATEMALELLREYQSAETERLLGDGTRGSELARASEDFKKYLDGLREATRDIGLGAEENLRQEISTLIPQPEVRNLRHATSSN